MKVTKNSQARVLPSEGTHVAILIGVIDWGTQTDRYGKRKKVELLFELPEETHEFNEERGPEPLLVDRKFGRTLGRGSDLLTAITGFTGEDIGDECDLSEYIGRVGQLQLKIETGAEYDDVLIQSYMTLPKALAKKKYNPYNDLIIVDLDPEEFDQEMWDKLPDWKKKRIRPTDEFQLLLEQGIASDSGEEEDDNDRGGDKANAGKSGKFKDNKRQAAAPKKPAKPEPKKPAGKQKGKNLFK